MHGETMSVRFEFDFRRNPEVCTGSNMYMILAGEVAFGTIGIPTFELAIISTRTTR